MGIHQRLHFKLNSEDEITLYFAYTLLSHFDTASFQMYIFNGTIHYLTSISCISSVESWLSAQSFCKNIGGNLPVLRQWEYLYHINVIVKPFPVYIGVTEVSIK